MADNIKAVVRGVADSIEDYQTKMTEIAMNSRNEGERVAALITRDFVVMLDANESLLKSLTATNEFTVIGSAMASALTTYVTNRASPQLRAPILTCISKTFREVLGEFIESLDKGKPK